jgi:D-alanyl-D-alanine carboxypeptidase (penicillin-binding protein 5/6)
LFIKLLQELEIVEYDDEELEALERRRRRREEMKRRKRQQEIIRRFLPLAIGAAVILIALVVGAVRIATSSHKKEQMGYESVSLMTGTLTSKASSQAISDEFAVIEDMRRNRTLGGNSKEEPLSVSSDGSTMGLSEDVVSENGIVIGVDDGRILAQKGATERISPASMTKILTVLVAAEHITNSDDTFEITFEIENYSYANDCSNVGFSVGEVVTVQDLFYGTILPSGADAALGLAIYTAGSQEAFVELMNEKLDELGISKTTHFTNCVGLYDDDHYSTVYDMAVIMKAAYDNSYCREVLSARTYTTSSTEQHPDGIVISNWFLRRIEDKETNGEVLCAKTGFVVQSGNCAASLSVGNDGKVYICVTAHSTSSWRCIYDHVALYQQFIAT